MSRRSLDVDAYLARIPAERREAVALLRELIFQVYPDIQENMRFRMPSYFLWSKPFCAIGSQKHYVSLYLIPYDLLEAFAEALQGYDCGKSCIRFRRVNDEDLALTGQILRYMGEHYFQSKRVKTRLKRKRR